MVRNIFSFQEHITDSVLLLFALSLGTVLSAQSPEVSEVMEIPSSSAKAEILEDSFFLVVERMNEVEKRSLSGVLQSSYHTGSTSGLEVLNTADFALDGVGNVHALLITKDEPRALIRKFETSGSYTHVSLSRPMQAWQIEMDDQGNYYLLGVANEVYFGALRGKQTATSSSIDIIHKFSATGTFLGSFFPVAKPHNFDELRPILQSIVTAHFVVLPSEDLFLLWDSADRRIWNVLQVPNQLYKIDHRGFVQALNPQPPFDLARIVGIHKYSGDLAIEWIKFADSQGSPPGTLPALPVDSAVLTLLQGTSQSTLQTGIQGKVLALEKSRCVTSMMEPERGLTLFLNQWTSTQ